MFKKDSFLLGSVLSLASLLLAAGVIYLIFALLHLSKEEMNKTLILAFIFPVILLRFYAKKQLHSSMKGVILSLIALFIVYFSIFFK